MKNIIYLFSVAILFMGISTKVFAQANKLDVDLLMQDALTKFGVAGASLAIIKDDKIIHSKGYGIRSVKSKSEVNEHTQFAIASNSKAFTTAALAILEEEGKISWEDKVIKHIPEFKMYDEYVTNHFNIVDLLTHRSGLGLGAGDLMFFPDGSDFTIDDIIACFQYFEPESEFRTKWDYDNLLYMVAGEVIARVSGMSWGEFVETRIFEPLGMNESYTSITKMTDRSNLASPHADGSGTLVELDHFVFDPEKVNGAAGDIISSVHDLTKWMSLQMNKGKYGKNLEKQLFSAQNHYKMWQIQTVMDHSQNPRYNSHFAGYGLGWFLTDVKGNLSVSHTGGLPGMLSKTIMIPDLSLGVVILTNTSDAGGAMFESVTRTIIDHYLGFDDFGWVDKFKEYSDSRSQGGDEVTEKVWGVVAKADQAKIKNEDFLGRYSDNWFGEMLVFEKQGKLWIKSIRSPRLNGEMKLYKGNTFAVKWEFQDMNADAFAIFSLDENGKADRIRMKGISPNIDFSFDFQDLDLIKVAE